MRTRVGTRAVLGAVLAACGQDRSPPTLSGPAVDLGALGMPAVVTGRDGGAATRVGAQILWTFGDTLMTRQSADGVTYRSATAAWGAGADVALREALDAAGTPFQLVPYTPEEWAYNQAGGPMERYALWPGSVLPADEGGARIVYAKLKVHPGTLNYENLGVGLAHLAPGATVATRDPGLLFAVPDRMYAVGGVADGGWVYLYACDPIPQALDSACRVVRAPTPQVATRAAWRAWDGGAWTADLTRAAPVLNGAPGDLSVSRNAYLGAFLAVYSGIFANAVYYRTAPRPEGPWSAPRVLFTAGVPADPNDYAAKEHPELASDGGRTLVVSYARPLGGFRGEIRLAAVTLP